MSKLFQVRCSDKLYLKWKKCMSKAEQLVKEESPRMERIPKYYQLDIIMDTFKNNIIKRDDNKK